MRILAATGKPMERKEMISYANEGYNKAVTYVGSQNEVVKHVPNNRNQ